MLFITMFSIIFMMCIYDRSSIKNILIYRIIIITLLINLLLIYNNNIENIYLFSNILYYDNKISLLLSIITIIAIIILMIIQNNKGNESIILIFSLIGVNILLCSNDIIIIYLAIELQSFPVYILASLNKYSQSSTSSALKYLFLGLLSSIFLLLGLVLMYSETGITNIREMNYYYQNSYNLYIILIVIALLFKIGAVPFHYWIMDVYDGIEIKILMWLSTIPKISLIFLLILLLNIIFPYDNTLLLFSSFLSLIIGSIYGITTNRIKKLLAYSSISHVGFILLILANNNISITIFYLISYLLTILNIFFILYLINFNFLSQLKSLSNPLLILSFTISFYSLAGIPPFLGFYNKLLILNESINNNYNLLCLIAIISSMISATYYLKIIKLSYFYKNQISSNNIWLIGELNSSLISILTFIITFFIIYPTPVFNLLYIGL